MTDADDLVRRIDATWGEQWFVGRSGLGHWVINGAHDELHVTGPTLTSTLEAAAVTRKLPVVPARPTVPELTIERTGNRWVVVDTSNGDRFVRLSASTRRQAQEALDHTTATAHDRLGQWDETYGALVTTGAEGADWRWAD